MSYTQSDLLLALELFIHIINYCNKADSPNDLVEKYSVTLKDAPCMATKDPV